MNTMNLSMIETREKRTMRMITEIPIIIIIKGIMSEENLTIEITMTITDREVNVIVMIINTEITTMTITRTIKTMTVTAGEMLKTPNIWMP